MPHTNDLTGFSFAAIGCAIGGLVTAHRAQAIPKIEYKSKTFVWITEMVELGLLTLVGKKPTGKRGPMKRLFTITPKGLATLERILKTVNFDDINRYSPSVPIVLDI